MIHIGWTDNKDSLSTLCFLTVASAEKSIAVLAGIASNCPILWFTQMCLQLSTHIYDC